MAWDAFKQSTLGQQGNPLLMPMFCATKKETRDRIPDVGSLAFAADYVYGGLDGGACDSVLKVLLKEIALGPGCLRQDGCLPAGGRTVHRGSVQVY